MDAVVQHSPRAAWTRRRVLASAGLASAAVACGTPAGSSQPAGNAEAPAKLLVKIRAGATYDQAFKEGITLFNQKFPKTTVEYFPEESGWPEKLLAGWAADAGADVMQAWDEHFWRFTANGVLVNVNDLLKDMKKADLDDFIKGQWNGFQIPGTNFRFGIPTYINIGVLYYNKNTFQRNGVKEPDTTWTYDTYAETAKRLTKMEGGRQVYGGFHPLSASRMHNTIWAFGGQIVDLKDFKKTTVHLPEAQEGIRWMQERHFKDTSFIPYKARPSGFAFRTALGDGTVAMAEEGMHALKDVAAVEGLSFDVAPLARGPKNKLTWITTDGWGMWKGSKAKDQAWEFTKFLGSTDWYRIQAKHDQLLPSRISVLDEWASIVRSKFPSLEKVNLKGVKDMLAASPPLGSTRPHFLCHTDAFAIVDKTMNDILREGTEQPSVFTSRKDQIETAAGACGLTLK
ncbi:MAG TPA: extracellular solute-binding protein [Chloroflexota bacterium]|nr:extracellular solute-binding protein [Chloroflexota bacterium]